MTIAVIESKNLKLKCNAGIEYKMAEDRKKKIDKNFEFYVRKRFTHIPEDEYQQMIFNVQDWILNSNRYRNTLKDLLDYSARTIYRIFNFKEISIGVKDPRDGLYKYVTVLGFTKKAESAQRKKTYTFDEIIDYDKYPGVKLSSTSDFCIEDGLVDTYNRPLQLDKKRESMEDFLEGDYIDISIYDSRVRLIGWLELANPKDGKILSKNSLLWIELFSSILGIMIERDFLFRESLRK